MFRGLMRADPNCHRKKLENRHQQQSGLQFQPQSIFQGRIPTVQDSNASEIRRKKQPKRLQGSRRILVPEGAPQVKSMAFGPGEPPLRFLIVSDPRPELRGVSCAPFQSFQQPDRMTQVKSDYFGETDLVEK